MNIELTIEMLQFLLWLAYCCRGMFLLDLKLSDCHLCKSCCNFYSGGVNMSVGIDSRLAVWVRIFSDLFKVKEHRTGGKYSLQCLFHILGVSVFPNHLILALLGNLQYEADCELSVI